MAAIPSKIKRKYGDLFSYGLLTMTGTHMLTHVFFRVHTTLFPTLQDEFNLSIQQLGLIAAIPSLCQALLAIPTGLLSDKFGSRKLILASMIVSAVGSLLASRASNPAMLIVAVSLVFINTTIYHPAAYSFVTRLFRPRDRLRALGMHGAGGAVGVAIGPLSITLIMGVLGLGWRQVYLFWFIPFLLGMLSLFWLKAAPEEDVPADRPGQETNPSETSLLSASLVMFLIFIGVRVIASGMSQSFMALYLVDERGISASMASFYIGLNILVGGIAAPLGGFMAVRYGEKKWLMIVLTLSYICFGLAMVVPDNAAFVVFYLAYGFLSFLGMAATSAIMAKLSPGKVRGLAYALFFLPGSMMGVVAPIMATYIGDLYGLGAILNVSAVIFFLSLAVLRFGVKLRAPC